jgi:transcriptional regulator with XRE-family HTH domain
MTTTNKTKTSRKLPALCEAIRRVRKATGKSQPVFAEEVEVSPMTLSRYERGDSPRRREVLNRLAAIAWEHGCTVEEQLFRDASMALPQGPFRFEPSLKVPVYSPHQWRLMQAIRIAQAYFPDEARAAEQALGVSLDLVDEILADAAVGERKVTEQLYSDLEARLNELAARKVFKDHFTKEGKLK